MHRANRPAQALIPPFLWIIDRGRSRPASFEQRRLGTNRPVEGYGVLRNSSRVPVFSHDARRNPCMFVVSWRSAMNFAREPFFCGTEEKIGKQVAQRVGDDEF